MAKRPGLALLACAGALAAAALAASQDDLIVSWAERAALGGRPRERRAAVGTLGRLGAAGVPSLLGLASDRTLLPHPDTYSRAPVPAGMLPPDTVGDLALAELRRLRTGTRAPAFEWNLSEGRYASHAEAWEAFRRRQLGEARRWWEDRRLRRLREHLREPAPEAIRPPPGP
jgi:hypothetical protein